MKKAAKAGSDRSEIVGDPVRQYLREMGTVNLLSRNEEIHIARKIERGEKKVVKALAHITGSGLPGNLPRVLPAGLTVRVKRDSWQPPPANVSFGQARLFKGVCRAGGRVIRLLDAAQVLRTEV